jgi:hypothetical protein
MVRAGSDSLRIEETAMKWLWVCVLVLFTLGVMRAGSWAVAWVVARLVPARGRIVAVIANLVSFAAFVLLLQMNLLPGEPVDWAALWFGLIVFVIYAVTDLTWRPWERGNWRTKHDER